MVVSGGPLNAGLVDHAKVALGLESTEHFNIKLYRVSSTGTSSEQV